VPSTETPHLDLLFAGSVFCDLVFAGVPLPEPGAEVYADAFKLTPGGVANRAVAGSRMGARTALLSQLGDDPLGLHMVAVLSAEPDLDLTWLRWTPGFQSPVTVSLTGAHEREFITYQEEADPLEWPVDRPRVGATHVSVERDLPDWVARLREQGTVVYGGVGWDSSGMWSGEVLGRLDQIDVFVPNDVEAMRYTQTDDAYAAARELGRYVELAVVTRGAYGAIAYERSTGQLTEVPSVKVTAYRPHRSRRCVRRLLHGERAAGLADRGAAAAGRTSGVLVRPHPRGSGERTLSLRHHQVSDRPVPAWGLVDDPLLGSDPGAQALITANTLSMLNSSHRLSDDYRGEQMSRSTKTVRTLAVSLALALAATACAPGGSTTDEPAASSSASQVSKDVSAAGDVTLTVWDQNTDTGINDAQEELNKQFQQKYPNVKIERVSRSFSDLKTTLKLALTSKNPPDVVQANQGYPDMGSFVSGGLLRPEDDYAKLYGWDTYFPEQQLNLNKFTADGKDWQSGNLYGVSQTGEIVGVYYNRKILKNLNLQVPKTITEFEPCCRPSRRPACCPSRTATWRRAPVSISTASPRPRLRASRR
jgi:sugar/nucleoside kinase (ribokinase family)